MTVHTRSDQQRHSFDKAAFGGGLRLFSKLGYDPAKDFASISRIMRIPLVLVVKPEMQVKTLREFLDLAKSNKLTYGSGSSSTQVASELLAKAAHFKATRVPYNGTNKAIIDLMANRLDFVTSDLTVAIPQIEAGNVRALGVTDTVRISELPDVPTIAEAGVPDYKLIGWIAAFVRKGTPEPIVQQLNAAFKRLLDGPDAKVFFAKIGGSPWYSTTTELDSFVNSEIGNWANLVEIGGIEKQ